MIDAQEIRAAFDAALPWDEYVATASPAQQESWRRSFERARLSENQAALVRAFERTMIVLVSSGVWCGDCAQQGGPMARIASANAERVRLRFLERDRSAWARRFRLNGGERVPLVFFAADDFEFAGLYGDRTRSRYRALAASQLGPMCPVPWAEPPAEENADVLADWLAEIERVQLMLRLSPRLRQRYGD